MFATAKMYMLYFVNRLTNVVGNIVASIEIVRFTPQTPLTRHVCMAVKPRAVAITERMGPFA